MKRTKVDLHIGELILYDVPYPLRRKVTAAIERELTRLLTERGVPRSLVRGGDIPHINVDSLPVVGNPNSDSIGTQVAQTVYSNLCSTPFSASSTPSER